MLVDFYCFYASTRVNRAAVHSCFARLSPPLLRHWRERGPQVMWTGTRARDRGEFALTRDDVGFGGDAWTLKRAGAERDVFNADAISIIHEHAQGRLRDIDRICTDALKLAAKKKARSVDRASIAHVIDHDLDDVVDG